MSGAAKVIDWNGRDVPEALQELLRELPPGQYTLERVLPAEEAGLTPEQELGILQAREQVARGETIRWEQARAEIEARFDVATTPRLTVDQPARTVSE